MALLIAPVFLTCVYVFIMFTYLRGWRAIPEWSLPDDYTPRTFVSVVVPARNEAANIATCLRSIRQGSYPPELLEIIVVDDFSDDATAELAAGEGSPVLLLQLSDYLPAEARLTANKKMAIETAVQHARGELIVTTDADCTVPKDWLRLIVSRFQSSPDSSAKAVITAPVAFHRERNLLQRFQSLDILGLMGITGAGIRLGFQRMGNAANLAFAKEVFEEVGGYEGNEHLASGDDIFLIQKINRRYPGSIVFLKNPAATVLTEATPDWSSFFQQRLRWGAKNAALPEWPVRLVLLAVFLFCWSILITCVLTLFSMAGVYATESNSLLPALLFQVTLKAVSDYVFLREMCLYFGRKDLLRWFLPSFFLHTAYVALVGTASLFRRKYAWKGREVGGGVKRVDKG